MKKKFENQLNIRIAVIIPAAAIIILILSFVLKRDAYSDEQGRHLYELPSVTLTGIMDGSFEEDIDSYLSDRVAFREIWLKVKNSSRAIMGNRESNGIYKGKNGYLIEKFTEPEEGQLEEITQAVSAWAADNRDSRVYFALVPTAEEILSDKLPTGISSAAQEEFMQNTEEAFEGTDVHYIDLTQTLKNHKSEEIFFKSDSNWSTLGAYYSYRAIGQEMELDMSNDNFEAMTVSESFKGNLATASGLACGKDDINVYFPVDSDFKQVVEYDEIQTLVSPYDSEALESNYKLDVFWGGNHSFIRINTSSASKNTLLIIKDSMGNNFIPFMMVNYREILVVDPRYYFEDINELVQSQTIDDVLFLYSTQSLAGDKALISVLKGE